MNDQFVVSVANLIGHPDRSKEVFAKTDVKLSVGDSVVEGPMELSGVVVGLPEAVKATFTVSGQGVLECIRCLKNWSEQIEATSEQIFELVPDEDGYRIEDHVIDLFGPGKDELALAIPLAPLCQTDCRGLCPACGNDLNNNPCGGHEEDQPSPFAALKDLFDS